MTAATVAQSSGVVSRFVKDHPVATTGLGLGAATLAATAALLGKLVGVVKPPFAAAARVLT